MVRAGARGGGRGGQQVWAGNPEGSYGSLSHRSGLSETGQGNVSICGRCCEVLHCRLGVPG